MERFRIGVNETKWIGQSKITTESNFKIITEKPSETAHHETLHAVVAEKLGIAVNSVTIIRDNDSLGKTKVSKPHAAIALAAKALNKSGTGHDEKVANMIGSAGGEATAKAIINSSQKEIQTVAALLDEKGTLSGAEVRNAMREAGTAPTATIFVRNPQGEEKVLKDVPVVGGEVFVPALTQIFPTPHVESIFH